MTLTKSIPESASFKNIPKNRFIFNTRKGLSQQQGKGEWRLFSHFSSERAPSGFPAEAPRAIRASFGPPPPVHAPVAASEHPGGRREEGKPLTLTVISHTSTGQKVIPMFKQQAVLLNNWASIEEPLQKRVISHGLLSVLDFTCKTCRPSTGPTTA